MKPFIEDRNLNKYEFNTLTRRQKLKLANSIKKMDKENPEEIENVFFDLLNLEYPSITRDEYEDILDFNEEKYGFSALYELISTILGDVFTQASGVLEVHPYLQAKAEEEKAMETAVEETQVEEPQVVTPHEEETPQAPMSSIYY